ncbi:hypothetical protein [Oceanibacterium hippocampi]|uniref:Glycosyl transferase family 8 n=1 Tax=Oceanibacterium hippocampi TaxID=745714 RepID=A0A1Y5U0T9_9PROT|nr:hypothetical protein [Oceanibacterium hippocampi]SLN76224.1 hypothetical protein OCH7691_04069 [Oceanibacterium hippocampi]
MRPCVFIHTNHRQMLGALVAQYSLKRNSASADSFDVRIIDTADHPFMAAREGQEYLRDGVTRPWRNDDLQSFTPLRFMPPELMGYEGRAVVMDPDIFAVGDIRELLDRDMEGKAILCRARSGPKGWRGFYASSVMLLDCARLTHWKTEQQFNEMFTGQRDYMPWISLKLEPAGSIGLIEPEWNDFDRLTPATKLLHNTRRLTQPWKTGLPIDWTPSDTYPHFPPLGWVMRWRRRMFGEHAFLGKYRRHPDGNQERFFFGLLRECIERGIVTEQMIRDEMERNHVRHDAFELLDRAPKLAA